jgi:hypothetical protein
MARHLRPVPPAPSGPTFVVRRTDHVRPGTPYVVAACIDRYVAEACAFPDGETYGREEMERHPALAEAVAAWDSGNDSLFLRERGLAERMSRDDRRMVLRSIGAHPSLQGRTSAP